ncbi:MAG: cell shape determination protein CcmA, partial [Stenotrophomonas nitritireducens]|nr:cell shape determination protein CcmA [Stenotrophomonas nitritireducens]
PTARVNGNVHYQVVELGAGAQPNGRLVHATAMAALPSPEVAALQAQAEAAEA